MHSHTHFPFYYITGRGLFHFVSQDKLSSMKPTSSQQPLQLLLACLCFLGLLLLLPVATATSTGSSVATITTKSSSSCSISGDNKKKSALDHLRRTHGGGGSSAPTPSASVSGTRGPDGKIVATPGQAFLTGLLSGAVAGITVDLTLFPLDTIKTRLQASANTRFSLDLLKGVYDGVGPGLLASAPACAAFFGAYDSFKRSLTARFPDPKLAPIVNMLAAAGGDLTQSVVRVPFEVVKQRMQAGVEHTWREAVTNIMASSGPKGFFAGWSALALRDLPFDIIEFPLYEALKARWAAKKGRPLETWEASVCGSLAGGLAAGLTTPLDVVKTRLMTQRAGQHAYTGLLDCLCRVATEEGVGALYRGLVPRVVNIALGGAIFFGAYEAFKQVADRALVQKDLDLVEWWAGVKAKAGEMRKRQFSRGVGGSLAKKGGFIPMAAMVGPRAGESRTARAAGQV